MKLISEITVTKGPSEAVSQHSITPHLDNASSRNLDPPIKKKETKKKKTQRATTVAAPKPNDSNGTQQKMPSSDEVVDLSVPSSKSQVKYQSKDSFSFFERPLSVLHVLGIMWKLSDHRISCRFSTFQYLMGSGPFVVWYFSLARGSTRDRLVLGSGEILFHTIFVKESKPKYNGGLIFVLHPSLFISDIEVIVMLSIFMQTCRKFFHSRIGVFTFHSLSSCESISNKYT